MPKVWNENNSVKKLNKLNHKGNDVTVNCRLAQNRSRPTSGWCKIWTDWYHPTPGPIDKVGSLLVKKQYTPLFAMISVSEDRCNCNLVSRYDSIKFMNTVASLLRVQIMKKNIYIRNVVHMYVYYIGWSMWLIHK